MSIRFVRWDITAKCNLNCIHCQAAKYNKKNVCNDLDTKDVKSIVDKLHKNNIKSMGLLGGEPLVRNDIVEILKYAYEKNIAITLNTNGILIDKFKNLKWTEYVNGILISLDGFIKEDHEFVRGKNTFEKTLNNIKMLRDYDDSLMLGISCVMNKRNSENIHMLYDTVKDLKVNRVSVDLVHKTGNAEDSWDNLVMEREAVIESTIRLIKSWDFSSDIILELRYLTNKFRDSISEIKEFNMPDKIVCEAPGITSAFISNGGILYPSQYFAYNTSKRSIGKMSLVDYELKDIIDSDGFKEFNKLYDKELYKSYYEPCKDCKYSGKQCNPSPITYWFDGKKPVETCNY